VLPSSPFSFSPSLFSFPPCANASSEAFIMLELALALSTSFEVFFLLFSNTTQLFSIAISFIDKVFCNFWLGCFLGLPIGERLSRDNMWSSYAASGNSHLLFSTGSVLLSILLYLFLFSLYFLVFLFLQLLLVYPCLCVWVLRTFYTSNYLYLWPRFLASVPNII